LADANRAVLISFVVPVRNDAARLGVCLDSIVRSSILVGPCEIIVADNGSEDDSREVARDAGAHVLSLPGIRVSALRNRAAAAAAGGTLAFVDADHQLGPDWARAVVEDLRDHRNAAVGAPYQTPPNATWVQKTYGGFRDHRPGIRTVSWLGSGNLAVNLNCFREIGGFDESLETCEDVDLCQRLQAHGYTILADSRLVNIHFGDPATLKQLLISEIWRGQDNLRVSFRQRPHLADIPSIVVPIADLAMAAASVVAIALYGRRGLAFAAVALAIAVALSSFRALRIVRRLRSWDLLSVLRALTVAAVYDCARAFALVIGVPHRRATAPRTT
jgi:GT2 family glycosyltransferase